MFNFMTTMKRSSLALMMAATLAITGCASTGSSMLSSGGAQPDPRLTQGSDAKFFSTSGYTACAAAAATGVLACALSNSSNKAVCAIAAGVAACGVAMGANYYLDQRRSEYKNTSDRLAAMSDDVRKDTRQVQERTQTALAVIQDDKRSLAQIQNDIKLAQLDQAAAKKDVARIDANLNVMRRDLDNMNKKVAAYREAADSEQGSKKDNKLLDAEIGKMNKQVASLQQEVDSLYDQRSAITLG